ncbi:hypothetical protein MBRA1_000651 [Malassezia brasiliensis]|uniref:Nucleolar pre-ribosomal-associated protein 1 n=1 Tax=Malassezia brasiliensis TaxID=1821822 RepID=A0AAF0DQE8_9BASI|nr:hypothetical protein MBRA1_000651 [Malassezia brasiliensis]
MPRPSVGALHAELASSSADATSAALQRLRSALRLHAADLGEYAVPHVAVTDERLLLAREVVEAAPPVLPLLFDAWDLAEQRSLPTLRPVPMQVLEQLLDLLSAHQTYHALGERILDRLLAPDAPWATRMHAYITAAVHSRRDKREAGNDTVAALLALKLFTAMANFARGKHALAVWERFHWTTDVHARLLSMRRRARAGSVVSLYDADIRTQYILFLHAMLTQSFHTPLKVAVLELGAEGVPLVLRGLASDPAEVVQYVLLVLHEEVFKDTHVPRGTKVKLFTEQTIASLLRLYTREHDTLGASTSVADLVHHFLLSIGTHPGFGLCYQDRGWYPKLDDGARAAPAEGGVYNKVLAHLVRQLSPIDDLRQQELALRILGACPELVASYLQSAHRTLALEPRADSAWLGSMAFVGRLLALPVPPTNEPAPPRVGVVLANTAPESLLRALGRGLRHADALVQYYACLVVARALQRVEAVQAGALRAATRLDEPPDGAWRAALRTYELAWRKRFPPVDAVAMLVHATGSMRQEVALRVLALYHTVLPSMTFDTRYDAGKLLTSAFLATDAQGPLHLERLCQLHALQLVARTTEAAYDLTARAPAPWPGCAHRSNVHFLLALYAATRGAVQRRAAALLCTQLERTALFAHDPAEVHVWLAAIPHAEANRVSVLNFVDECVQRCLKTPHRYVERARAHMALGAGGPVAEDACPSPLLMVMVEQAQIRLGKRLFDTAEGVDANASAPIVAYIARVVLRLMAYAKPYAPLRALIDELAAADPTHLAARAGAALVASVAAPTRADVSADVWDTVVDAPGAAEDAAWSATLAVVTRDAQAYEHLAETAGAAAWPMLFVALLERLDDTATSEAVHAAFDVLCTWSATYELSVPDLERYVLQRARVRAWLTRGMQGTPGVFRERLVDFVCRIGAARPAYAPGLAPLVDDVARGLQADVRDAALLRSAARLAHATPDATPIVRALLADVPAAGSKDAAPVLACLASCAAASMQQGAHEALGALHDALPRLLPHATTPSGVRVVATVLRSALPPGLDATHPPTCGTLRALQRVRAHLADAPLATLADAPDTAHDVVLMRCVYAMPYVAPALVAAWAADVAVRIATLVYTPLALLDAFEAADVPVPDGVAEGVVQAVPTWRDAAPATLAARCIACAGVARRAPAHRDTLIAALDTLLRGAGAHVFSAALVWVVSEVGDAALTAQLSALALRCIVQQFADDDTRPAARAAVRAYTALLVRGAPADAELVEPVLEAVARYRALDVDALRLARIVLRAAPVRAACATRVLHTLLAHTELVGAARNEGDALRAALVPLLAALLAASPPDVLATPTSHARIVFLYTGTCSAADRALLRALRRDERGRRAAVLDALRGWTADAKLVPSALSRDTLLAALGSLDAQRAHATCVALPAARLDSPDAYDPWLVLNLVGGAIFERAAHGTRTDDDAPAHLTGLEWLAIVRTGALGVVVCALSSPHTPLRLAALRLLGKVLASVQRANFRERDLLTMVLVRVRDAVPPPPPTSITGAYDEVPWLPTTATLFMAHCLRAVALPHLVLFPTLCRFLLQRPRLDVHDVPLLYNLLYAASDHLHHERSWLLRFLDDALAAHAHLADARTPDARRRTRTDWRVFQRRHVWDLVLSLYDALADNTAAAHHANAAADARDLTRLASIISRAAAVPYLATTLVARRGLLHWASMRVTRGDRGTNWLQLVASIAGTHLDRAARIAHLDHLDTALQGTMVLAALDVAARAWPSDIPDADATKAALALVHALLEYAALRGPASFGAQEARVATRLLQALAPYAQGAPHAETFAQCVLYTAQLTPAPHDHALVALFARQLNFALHARTYAPRAWALRRLSAASRA